jgi:hypothetical protein
MNRHEAARTDASQINTASGKRPMSPCALSLTLERETARKPGISRTALR